MYWACRATGTSPLASKWALVALASVVKGHEELDELVADSGVRPQTLER